MSLRSRRAMMPRSTSASTTTRPDTMCSPPANRSSDATSARRALTELTTSRLSSSLTSAVIATGRHLSVRSLSVWAQSALRAPAAPSRATAPLPGPRPTSPGHVKVYQVWTRQQTQLRHPEFWRCGAIARAPVRSGTRLASTMMSCTVNPGACCGKHVDMPFGGELRRLPWFGNQVEHQRPPRRCRLQRRHQLRDQHMRDDAGEPRPRSEHHQVGGHDRVHRLTGGGRIAWQQPDPAHLAHGGRDRHLAADHPAHPRIGFQTRDVGLDLQRRSGTSAAPGR